MKNTTLNKSQIFLRSALTEENLFITTEQVLSWLKHRNEQVKVNVQRIKFSELDHWSFDQTKASLRHSSGKFFSIEGINIVTNYGKKNEWDQPIINQPEIGYLGIITKEFNGILYLLMQAKIEPGNVNSVQLSPTLQATKSNYTQVHKGKKPLYLDYFLNRSHSEILVDQLQSEQGARFLRKRNRNIIIKVNSEINAHEDFVWLTLGQIKRLMKYDNVVNMDARTVVSGINFGDYHSEVIDVFHLFDNSGELAFNRQMLNSAIISGKSLYTFDDIIAWFTDLKAQYDLSVSPKPLSSLRDWIIDNDEIHHVQNKYFKVIATNVEIGNREVTRWAQPLIQPAQEGLIAFVVKKIDGIQHVLMQAKLECGNFDVLEFAPTVQCLTGNYRETESGKLPFLDYVLTAKKDRIRFDTLQSEEGGRFYREQNRNVIIEADEEFPVEVPSNYIWMTLNQLFYFIKFNNYLNIQSRSLLAAIDFI